MNYLDLFAGCGGLSLGLRAAGLNQVSAVEKSSMAAETYFRNLISHSGESFESHLKKDPLSQLDAGLLVDDAKALLQILEKARPESLKSVDVVVGGPPCQGFSLAGKRDPSDERNQLPWLFLEIVSRLSPKFVVIENVAGMKIAPEQGNISPFDDLAEALSECGQGYKVQKLFLNSAHFGAPQNRLRLFLMAVRADLAEKMNLNVLPDVWRSEFVDCEVEVAPKLAPRPSTRQSDARSVRDAILDLCQVAADQSEYASDTKSKFERALVEPSQVVQNHEERKHTAGSRQRFALMQLLRENGISFSKPDLKLVKSLRYPLADELGNQYNSPTSVVQAIRRLQTKKHSQKLLKWELPSPTVLTIPDDYVHPSEPRVLTVREMARIQGFPDSFTFYAKATTGGSRRSDEVPQFSQVGNAVSPWVALALGELLLRLNSEVS